jgi:hypothetical protein
MRRVILGVAVAACAVVGTASAKQGAPVEFSATSITQMPQAKQPMSSKLYVGEGQMRIETEVMGIRGISLMDLETGTMTMLMPEKRMAMDMPLGSPEAPKPVLLAPGGNPCTGQRDMTCERLGTERVSGYSTQKWRMVPISRSNWRVEMTVWFAPALGGFPIRSEDANGLASQLTDIRVGKQPDSLFEIPANYRRVGSPKQ